MTHPISSNSLLEALRWRYAVKAFDSRREIPAGTWEALEEALVLTPSSFGMQPWRFLVLTDRALRERLVAHAWGQRQVADCSHFLVCCRPTEISETMIDQYLRRIEEVRGTPGDRLEGLRRMIKGYLIPGASPTSVAEWATHQVYIALGNFMTAAALVGVDTCPMEGFEAAKFDEILQLPSRGWASVVCCAAGYRAADDKYAQLAKVRFPREQVVERL